MILWGECELEEFLVYIAGSSRTSPGVNTESPVEFNVIFAFWGAFRAAGLPTALKDQAFMHLSLIMLSNYHDLVISLLAVKGRLPICIVYSLVT